MKLYHLDWDKSLDINPMTHFNMIRPSTPTDYQLIKKAFEKGGLFDHVADLDFDDAEDVFAATQHGDRPWYETPEAGVRPIGNARRRSTAIGDIIVTDKQTVLIATRGMQPI